LLPGWVQAVECATGSRAAVVAANKKKQPSRGPVLSSPHKHRLKIGHDSSVSTRTGLSIAHASLVTITVKRKIEITADMCQRLPVVAPVASEINLLV